METLGYKKCENVMLKGLLARFRSNLRLKQYRLDMGDAVIREFNRKDRYWATVMPWLCVDHMIQQVVWHMVFLYPDPLEIPDPLAKSRHTDKIQTHW